CNRDYVITPARTDYLFEPQSATIQAIKKKAMVNFVAVPLARAVASPSPSPSPSPAPCRPQPKSLPEIGIGNPMTGRLSSETALCDERVKGYFNAYLLKGALGGDILQFDFQSLASADLSIQVFNQSGEMLKFESTA